MASGDRIAREELAALAGRNLLRTLEPLSGPPGVEVTLQGPRGEERLVSFSSNDYLGLAAHPQVRTALAEGALRWGSGASASRLVAGDFAPHHQLERALADFEGSEAAALFNSGYAANTGILPALVGPRDAVFSDALNHASLVDGCRLSRAQVHVYPHGDAGALERQLREARGAGARRLLVVSDTVFSMDGDLAPLPELAALCERYGALLVVDEAHATGVLGPQGAGLAAALGLAGRCDVRMGTLSKAAGALGAYAACSAALRELLVNRARPLIFSTALPPALACAALEAVRILCGPEGDERRARLQRRIARFAAGLRALGLPAAGQSPIFPVVLGSPERALAVGSALRARGVLAKPIRPPSVPEGKSRLRFALSSEHSDAQLELALQGLRSVL
jgi:8-amino-7-oxononanoate synthase